MARFKIAQEMIEKIRSAYGIQTIWRCGNQGAKEILDVIKNNFFEIEISPNFRIADTAEIDLLKQEVLQKL